jgi:hypothetical protein
MAKTAVAVKEETQLALPGFMAEQVGLGTEALDASSVEIPRVKLMQALSPELQEYNTLKQGHFFHTLAEQDMGPSVRVTPIYVDSRFILWRPRDSGGGILARADDGIHWSPANTEFNVKLKGGQEVVWRTATTVAASKLDTWGSSNPADSSSPPAATRMFNLVCTFPDYPDLPPAVVTLQRAAIKVARRFIGKLKITRAPSFGLIFDMVAVEDRNTAGQKYWNYSFKGSGMVQDETTYRQNHEYYKYFKSQGIQVKDIEDAQHDDIAEDEPAGDGKGPAF